MNLILARSLRIGLYVTNNRRLTKHAPNPRWRLGATPGPWWWDSPRFQAVCVAQTRFRQSGAISSRLVVDWQSRVETHQRVPLQGATQTQAVGTPLAK